MSPMLMPERSLDGGAGIHPARGGRRSGRSVPQQGRAPGALTPNVVFLIEVQLPPITHDVPVKAIERWLRTPSVSPREEVGEASSAAAGSDIEVELQSGVIAEAVLAQIVEVTTQVDLTGAKKTWSNLLPRHYVFRFKNQLKSSRPEP